MGAGTDCCEMMPETPCSDEETSEQAARNRSALQPQPAYLLVMVAFYLPVWNTQKKIVQPLLKERRVKKHLLII